MKTVCSEFKADMFSASQTCFKPRLSTYFKKVDMVLSVSRGGKVNLIITNKKNIITIPMNYSDARELAKELKLAWVDQNKPNWENYKEFKNDEKTYITYKQRTKIRVVTDNDGWITFDVGTRYFLGLNERLARDLVNTHNLKWYEILPHFMKGEPSVHDNERFGYNFKMSPYSEDHYNTSYREMYHT